MSTNVVTRFAPSPTGTLHVGGARTAVYNWLMAKQHGGKFILRIEDTDRQRSTPEATQAILDGMTWLGLTWDDIFYQSKRTDLHNQSIDTLLESGKAYYCECSPEQVQAMRDKAMAEKRKPKYDYTCRNKNLGPGPGRVVRLAAPMEGRTSFQDMVKGSVSYENKELDDLILRRTDGSPTYNLAVVVDDYTMGVTTIIRGDDHLNNTPRQILLYNALGLKAPVFGHVPMILGPDKKKLSKRHGATSLMAYKELGILPQAMLNYLLRLGWSHGDQEIFSKKEMISLFTPDNLGTSASVFDMDKLHWLNSQYIKEEDLDTLASLLQEQLRNKGLPDAEIGYLKRIIPLLQPRAKTMLEMAEMADFFIMESASIKPDDSLRSKFLTEEALSHLHTVAHDLESLDSFSKESLENCLGQYIERTGIKFKLIAQPLRVALTGKTASPGLFETMEVLGKEETLLRLQQVVSQ